MRDRATGRRSKQRGVALIMTLGILALLLIMAMSFSYTSKTNEIAAGINADIMQARLMCESGVSRLLAAMKTTLDSANPDEAAYPPTWGSFFSEYGIVNSNPPTGHEAVAGTLEDASPFLSGIFFGP